MTSQVHKITCWNSVIIPVLMALTKTLNKQEEMLANLVNYSIVAEQHIGILLKYFIVLD